MKYDPAILPPGIYPIDVHIAIALQWLFEFELHLEWQIERILNGYANSIFAITKDLMQQA